MGMVKEAITTILKAVGKDPRLGALYIHLGDVHFFMGNPEKAIGFYTIGIKLEPDFPGIAETFGKLTAIRALSNRLEPDKSGQYSWQNQLKAPFVYAQYDQILDFLLKQFHTTQPIEPSKKVVE
jgi:tetratricopeptide (TPR) repeat protein